MEPDAGRVNNVDWKLLGKGTNMDICVVDVGGTAIKYTHVEGDNGVRAVQELVTPTDDHGTFLRTIADIARGADGLALCVPGIVDPDTGTCLTAGAVTHNAGACLKREFEALLGIPVTVENDAKCAATAELATGSLAGVSNGMLITLGTGLGGALVMDGKLVHGRHFYAGELSFPTFDPARWGDFAAKSGVLYSTNGLVARARSEYDLAVQNGRELFALVNRQDARAVAALRAWCRDLDVMLFNLAVVLDLERIAVGGGVSEQPALIDMLGREMERLYDELPQGVKNSPVTPPEIAKSAYGASANLVGAWLDHVRRTN